MKKYKVIFVGIMVLFTLWVQAQSILISGDASMNIVQQGVGYSVNYSYDGKTINTLDPDNPISLSIDGKAYIGAYTSYSTVGDTIICLGNVVTPNGSEFNVSDKYLAMGNGEFELSRKICITSPSTNDKSFNSFYGIQANQNAPLTDCEYLVPGIWYRSNFDTEFTLQGDMAKYTNQTYYYFREDRVTLPLVMLRKKGIDAQFTASIIHKDCNPTTIMDDSRGILASTNYQFGSIGVRQLNSTASTTLVFAFPGIEKEAGIGTRSHPVTDNLKHEYTLRLAFSKTADYATAVQNLWTHAFDLYNPKVRKVDEKFAYTGLIQSLLYYYQPDNRHGGLRDAAGWPFEVGLIDNYNNSGKKAFEPIGINYDMGFVGMQVSTGYYIYRDGAERNDSVTRIKGEAVLDFWADKSLTRLGLPRRWYDPKVSATATAGSGSFRYGSNFRAITGGMEALISGWNTAKRFNTQTKHANWLTAITKFGNWLIDNQNADGSYYFEYNHGTILIEAGTGKEYHPATNTNKFLTICAVRYLSELYAATGELKYKTAALKAGKYCFDNIHNKYQYVACVVDNAQTLDSESGQQAMYGFMSLYDLANPTGDIITINGSQTVITKAEWLKAAEKAAIYTETYTYMHEIPAEPDIVTYKFPKDSSIVGQHLIATGNHASDLGFAWSAFYYYRLYLETGNEHYLHVAQISLHNTKQSMNWSGKIYQGSPRGLQLEAFNVFYPRRTGLATCLNWNYAAHLDPMMQFKDAFGTINLDQIESLPLEERKRLSQEYGKKLGTSNTLTILPLTVNIEESADSVIFNPVNNPFNIACTIIIDEQPKFGTARVLSSEKGIVFKKSAGFSNTDTLKVSVIWSTPADTLSAMVTIKSIQLPKPELSQIGTSHNRLRLETKAAMIPLLSDYFLYRNDMLIGSTTGEFLDKNLSAGSTYTYYAILQTSDGYVSAKSAEINATTLVQTKILDPGFEIKDFTNWVTSGDVSITDTAASGIYACQLKGVARITQSLTGLKANTKYTIKCKAKVSATSNVKMYVLYDNKVISSVPFDSSGYKSYNVTFQTTSINLASFFISTTSGSTAVDDFEINEVITTDLSNNVKGSNNLKLYPNPVKETLYIECPSLTSDRTQVMITDFSGRVVMNKTLNIATVLTIDTSKLIGGVYYLSLINENTISFSKFVKL